MSFHEIRFPTDISRGAQGGPERRTDVVVLGSGFEERNAAGRTRAAATTPATASSRSTTCTPSSPSSRSGAGGSTASAGATTPTANRARRAATPSPLDQVIGTGDGTHAAFQLVKTYGAAHAPWYAHDRQAGRRAPCASPSTAMSETRATTSRVDAATGFVHVPAGARAGGRRVVTAGFEFDVPVRFDTDRLEINLSGFRHGAIPHIPIVEVRYEDSFPPALAGASRQRRDDAVLVLAADAPRRRRLGFTDHDRDLTFDGTTFEAAAGFTASEMRDLRRPQRRQSRGDQRACRRTA